MKQKKIVEETKRNGKRTSIRKLGTMLGMGTICVLTIGAIGAMSVIGDADMVPTEETVSAQTNSSVIEWKKASINEYDFANEAIKITTKKKTTTKQTTVTEDTVEETASQEPVTTVATTAKKTEKVQSISSKTMYVKEAVNFRTGASKNCDVIKVLDAGKKVTVNGKTNDGWYRVQADGVTGYCMADFLTKTAPSKKTTTKAKAPKPTATNSGTISYTDEELEMMCYVLQNEAGGCSEASIIAVSNVIINRVKSPNFPNSLSGVLTQANQFTAISNYYNKVNAPSQKIRECVKRALNGEDNSNGALFYYAPMYCGTSAWFESLNFCMELEGQRFFSY